METELLKRPEIQEAPFKTSLEEWKPAYPTRCAYVGATFKTSLEEWKLTLLTHKKTGEHTFKTSLEEWKRR